MNEQFSQLALPEAVREALADIQPATEDEIATVLFEGGFPDNVS